MFRAINLLYVMLIHCTQKLSKTIPGVSTTALTEKSPLGSWHSNLYLIGERNYLLFCHDSTRYTIFIPGLRRPDFGDLGLRFKKAFVQSLKNLDLSPGQIHRAELTLGSVVFDTCTDRSVLGSLNHISRKVAARVQEIENVMAVYPPAITHTLYQHSISLKDKNGVSVADNAMHEQIMKLANS